MREESGGGRTRKERRMEVRSERGREFSISVWMWNGASR